MLLDLEKNMRVRWYLTRVLMIVLLIITGCSRACQVVTDKSIKKVSNIYPCQVVLDMSINDGFSYNYGVAVEHVKQYLTRVLKR